MDSKRTVSFRLTARWQAVCSNNLKTALSILSPAVKNRMRVDEIKRAGPSVDFFVESGKIVLIVGIEGTGTRTPPTFAAVSIKVR